MSVPAPAMIGIFGGTFDPVHFGHLRAASEAKKKLGIDDFRLLPARLPPHRERTWSSPAQRLDMLRLAIRNHADLAIDERELGRSGPSWMVDTLADFRREFPSNPLCLLIGQDSANHLDTWHRWEELSDLAHIVVMQRPGSSQDYSAPLAAFVQERIGPLEELRKTPCGRVLYVRITQLDISSTGIREMIRSGDSPRFLLPDAVLEYLGERGLFSHRQP